MAGVNTPPVLPKSDLEIRELKDLHVMLSQERGQVVFANSEGKELPIPHSIDVLLQQAVEALLDGAPVSLIPRDAEMTTQQAADYLNVSRPYLIKLLDSGDIPYSTVGRHRRILASDLLEYKEVRNRRRRKSLSERTSFLHDKGFYGS